MRPYSYFIGLVLLIQAQEVNAQLELLRDINSQPSKADRPEHFTAFGNGYLLTLRDQELGRELWFTDGTLANTRLVRDINPFYDAFQGADPCFVVMDNVAYFFADDDIHGLELWRTDGSNEGTWLVKDVRPGAADGVGSELVVSGGHLFFAGRTDAAGRELWVSDGTEAGTIMVQDILPGGNSSNPRSLVDFNGTLFFEANDNVHGYELWRSDGILGGLTERITDIDPAGSSNVHDLTPSGNVLYFVANPGTGNGLFRMADDLIPVPVAEFANGAGYINEMVGFGDGRVLLAWQPSVTGWTQPWVTDGTTHTELTIAVGGSSYATDFFLDNGLIYFRATDGTDGTEPYRTDGTLEGTIRIMDIHPTGDSYPHDFVSDGDHVYFLAENELEGMEIWRTDGSPGDATLAVDLTPGAGYSDIDGLTATAQGLAFAFADTDLGMTLATFSDGSTEGTTVLATQGPVTLGSNAFGFRTMGDLTLFRANDGVHGTELWVSDGTTEGTLLIGDLLIGEVDGVISDDGHVLNGAYYFPGEIDGSGSELFKTLGTPGSADLVVDAFNGEASGCMGSFFDLDGHLFYTGASSTNGVELWRTDAAISTSSVFLDALPGEGSSDIRYRATVNGVAVLVGVNALNEQVLWRTDGSAEGTYMVNTFGNAPINSIGTAQGLHFFYTCNTIPCQVYQTDGTVAGTTANAALQPYGPMIRNFIPFGTGAFFFVEYDQGAGKGFYYWDGAGTVTSVYDGSSSLNSVNYGQVVLGNKVASLTATPSGVELVLMDPISLEVEIIEIQPGPGSGSLGPMTVHEGLLYFEGTDGSGPPQLWRSDGTVAGTFPVTEPGAINSITAFSSSPEGLIIAGTGADHGRELYRYRPQGRLALKGILGGAYDASTGLMRGSLAQNGLLAGEDPYEALGMLLPGTLRKPLSPTALTATDGDAIVDWVLVELRDGASPDIVVETHPALLQRDGDVVDTDGRSALNMGTMGTTYHIAMRHRNHLGAMVQVPAFLGSTLTAVDMSDPVNAKFGAGATALVNGHDMLWPGNVLLDAQIKYTGADNDRDPILVAIGGTIPTNVVSGYLQADVNLDGQVKYTGSNNDRDLILQTIGGVIPTQVRNEQLP